MDLQYNHTPQAQATPDPRRTERRRTPSQSQGAFPIPTQVFLTPGRVYASCKRLCARLQHNERGGLSARLPVVARYHLQLAEEVVREEGRDQRRRHDRTRTPPGAADSEREHGAS